MSLIASTWSEITNSPLNLSKSKQCYSIPKAHRFTDKIGANCAQAFYDLPAVKEKRSTGLGYGKKYDFTKVGQKNPAPNSYKIPDSFERPRGVSFGVSREKMNMGSGIMASARNGSPGPGTYNYKSTLTNVAYSIRKRTNLEANITYLKVPGPGAYSSISAISKDGKFILSKYSGSKAPYINPAKSARFDKGVPQGQIIPGPGYYNPNFSIKPDGTYFFSNFHNSRCRSFSHAVRSDLNSGMTYLKNPGPGAYKLPSEFGHYESVRKLNLSVDNIKEEKKEPKNKNNKEKKK